MAVSLTLNLTVSLGSSMTVSLEKTGSAQRWRAVSPRVVSTVRLDEVLVAVLGEEAHQLLVGPVEERERAAECS